LKLKIVVQGTAYDVEVGYAGETDETEFGSSAQAGIQSSVLPSATRFGVSSEFDETKVCRSPLAAVVARVQAEPRQHVQPGDLLLVIDAMKMEIKITAQLEGTVKSIEVATGNAVGPGQILAFFE
jgi:biotin carboxyl carrier protein